MKKMLLGAVGLSAVLASCGGVTVVNPVRNLNLTEYQTEYSLRTAVTDSNGTTYAAGSSVICDNLNTKVQISTTWNGALSQLAVRLSGRNNPSNTKEIYSQNFGGIYNNGETRFEFVIAPGLAPASASSGIGAQSIVVTPINSTPVTVTAIRGATFLDIQARSNDGTLSNVSRSVQALPVANCVL